MKLMFVHEPHCQEKYLLQQRKENLCSTLVVHRVHLSPTTSYQKRPSSAFSSPY
uniref:Uncharacterized protein n=1 Tax=Medicago truncatula TaxID=3880 RepID=I3SYP1_MEDTR|nr:unknown [Medicago truncatula]